MAYGKAKPCRSGRGRMQRRHGEAGLYAALSASVHRCRRTPARGAILIARHMARRIQIQLQQIRRAIRLASSDAAEDAAVSYYRAPTLADELSGVCSVDVIGELAQRIRTRSDLVATAAVDVPALQRLNSHYRLAERFGIAGGLVLGAGIGAVVAPPHGVLLGLFAMPGPVFALPGPFVLRWLLFELTALGRHAVRMAYGVHLRALERESCWHALSWREFERDVAELFRRTGFDVVHTGRAGDGGIDIRATNAGVTLLIQCKKYSKAVGPAIVRELVGAAASEKQARPVLVSAVGFTAAATVAAGASGVILLDVSDLVQIQRRSEFASYL